MDSGEHPVSAAERTFIVTVHNEFTWNDGYTMQDFKEAIEGFGCATDCERASFVVSEIKEVSSADDV